MAKRNRILIADDDERLVGLAARHFASDWACKSTGRTTANRRCA